MGDGLGVEYDSLDKANEDFVVIDGKHYKLDQTVLKFNQDDLMSRHQFQTVKEDKAWDRWCEVEFVPQAVMKDGLDAFLLKFVQYMVYGQYSGKCVIDRKVYQFKNVLGGVEHVRARY